MQSNNTIDIIIFSYNRAMQLNTLIESVYNYFDHDFNLTILYNNTQSHKAGYEKLKEKYPAVKFVKEDKEIKGYKVSELIRPFNLKRYIKYAYIRNPKSDFRSKLISILEGSDSQFVMFLTDDSVFIKKVALNEELLDRIKLHPSDMQYSLRLGENINSPESYAKENNFMVWHFYNPENTRDWRYNFSVDAHIYDRKFILQLAKDIIFTNPNSYESFTKIRICQKKQQSCGVANLTPCILSFPINMVQAVQDNESLAVSTEDLERYFMDGFCLRYKEPDVIDTFQYYPSELLLEKDGKTTVITTSK